VITGVAALVALSAAGAYAATTAGRLTPVAAPLAAIAVGLLAMGIILRWPGVVPWTIMLTAAAYLVAHEGETLIDGWAAVIGVLLLLAAELAFWSIDHDARIRTEPALVIRRGITLVMLAAVALVVDFLLLGTAGVAASSGALLAAVGVAAAVTAVAIVLRLVRA
jgi:hypothetical protein